MSSSICIRRLSLFSSDVALPSAVPPPCLLRAPHTAPFSTSSAKFASPLMKKKGLGASPKKGVKTLNTKKGKKDVGREMAKRPAMGERKALRKRIVLSNTNALEVSYLSDLTAENVLSKEVEGKVMGFPGQLVDSLRAVEAFKTTQGWNLFRRPASLMRKETSQVANLLKEVEEGEEKQTIRRILAGDTMSGKTTLLLQALAMGFLRNWVVVNLPDAKDIVLGHTEYAPLAGTKPTLYTQDTYTANLLSQIAKANASVLSTIQAKDVPALPVPVPPNTTLQKLAEIGVANPEASWPIFQALWAELTKPGRPPIILTVDGLAHVMTNSGYLSADIKPVHAHDLTIVRHFMDHLSGKATLSNGGLVLAATSGSNQPACPALDFSIEVAEARARDPSNVPIWNPYITVDERAMEVLKGVDVLRLKGITKEEARSIMEYYAASGMLLRRVDETLVGEKWTLAGAGNIGELERASVRMRI